MFLTDFNYRNLQRAAFNLVMSMEIDGLQVNNLLNIISLDFSSTCI